MKAGALHGIVLTSEQLGYVEMTVRQSLKKDRKGARKFGDDLRMDSSLAHRLRVGSDVEDVVADARAAADMEAQED